MFWAKRCLGPYVMNSVGKVVLNVTAMMLCFRVSSLLNISVQTSLHYHGLNMLATGTGFNPTCLSLLLREGACLVGLISFNFSRS